MYAGGYDVRAESINRNALSVAALREAQLSSTHRSAWLVLSKQMNKKWLFETGFVRFHAIKVGSPCGMNDGHFMELPTIRQPSKHRSIDRSIDLPRASPAAGVARERPRYLRNYSNVAAEGEVRRENGLALEIKLSFLNGAALVSRTSRQRLD